MPVQNDAAAFLARARSFSERGASDAAVALLRRRLSGWNPYMSPARAGVRDVAEFYVRLAGNDPAEEATVAWAAYLHRATLSLGGDGDVTAKLLVEQVHGRGRPPVDAPAVATSVADEQEILSVRLSVAGLLQAGGLCGLAERETLAALSQCASHHEETPEVTYGFLADALDLLEVCGRGGQRVSLLNAYGALLPDLDEFLRSRAGTGRGNSGHREVCGLRRSISGG